MVLCKDCKFWTRDGEYDWGSCSKIIEKLDVRVSYSWNGGYIDSYDTDEDFGCVLGKKK